MDSVIAAPLKRGVSDEQIVEHLHALYAGRLVNREGARAHLQAYTAIRSKARGE